MNTDLISYYKDRAKEYDRIYAKPERQGALKEASTLLQELFKGKDLIEIACGTGYWTEKIAETADAILATDINDTVLDIARHRAYPKQNATFAQADLFQLAPGKLHESLFGGFIWSHIPLQELDSFIQTVNHLVVPGGMVVFMDNNYVEGSSIPIAQTDEAGNTFQLRKLDDGTSHLVLKNFPDEALFHHLLKDTATDIRIIQLEYYWILVYHTR